MFIGVKKLDARAVLPTYAKQGDAGCDLTAVGVNHTAKYVEYKTGLAFVIPPGHVGLLFPRSSVSKKDLMLSNAVGVLDSGYRGEVTFRYKKINGNEEYAVGERVGQIVIVPIPSIKYVEIDELPDSERGVGGYGSTGA